MSREHGDSKSRRGDGPSWPLPRSSPRWYTSWSWVPSVAKSLAYPLSVQSLGSEVAEEKIMPSESFGIRELIPLLEQDVVRTLGTRYSAIVHDAAANVETLGIAARCEKLVNDVQQYLNDALIDATWPPCPRHPAHSLTYRDGAWWCDRDTVPIAAVGDLGT